MLKNENEARILIPFIVRNVECRGITALTFCYKLDLGTVKGIDEYNYTYWYKFFNFQVVKKILMKVFMYTKYFLLYFIDAVWICSNICVITLC